MEYSRLLEIIVDRLHQELLKLRKTLNSGDHGSGDRKIVDIDISEALAVELSPVIVAEPGRTAALGDLVSVPEAEINVSLKLVPVLPDQPFQLDIDRVARSVADSRLAPCVNMALISWGV